MFGIAGLVLLFVVDLPGPLRPLSGLHPIPIVLAITLALFVLELRARNWVLRPARALTTVVPFALLCVLSLALRRPEGALEKLGAFGVPFVAFAIVAHMERAQLRKLLIVLVAAYALTAAFGVVQVASPVRCVLFPDARFEGEAVIDGRVCPSADREGSRACHVPNLHGVVPRCEHIGFFGTTTMAGRIAYLGALRNPNDLALALVAGAPLLLVFWKPREDKGASVENGAVIVALALFIGAILLTRSRGALLALIAAAVACAVRRIGIRRGALLAGGVGLLAAILAWRRGESADQSSIERMDLAIEALRTFHQHPFLGVGYQQYPAETPHDAYLLAAAELGALGFILFGVTLFASIRACWVASESSEGPERRVVATALLGSIVGLTIGSLFLSWTYHFVLWLHLGIAAGISAHAENRRLPS